VSIKEKALDLFDSAKEPAFDMACEVFLDGVVVTVAPGIVTTYMSYKQKRQEKIEYLVNGLINIAAIPDIKEDFILTYYDTLKETRIRDIAVLKFYENILNIQEFLEKTYKGKNYRLKSFKRIDKKDSFQISKFGKEFIRFFNNIE
jgi:hypothetical protein